MKLGGAGGDLLVEGRVRCRGFCSGQFCGQDRLPLDRLWCRGEDLQGLLGGQIGLGAREVEVDSRGR